jgi:hypothetical protein
LVNKKKQILDFWTLCEIADFDRFKIGTLYQFEIDSNKKKIIRDELYKNRSSDIDFKKKYIKRVYIGLLKTDETIEFIYKKLSERNLLPDSWESDPDNEIEKIPDTNTYTYMAYIYLDEDNNMISINDSAIVINPLFYILKNLLEKNLVNTQAYQEFMKSINSEFCKNYKIQREPKAYIILDQEFLKKNQNISFLSSIKNAYIYISKPLQKIIDDKNNNTSYNEENKWVKYLREQKENNNPKFIFEPLTTKKEKYINDLYLDGSINIANELKNDFIYLLTNREFNKQELEIPNNLYIVSYIDKDKKLYPSLKYRDVKNDTKITLDKYNEIFEKYSKILYLTTSDNEISRELFYDINKKIIYYQNEEKTFSEIDSLTENEILSHYINALDETPQKLTNIYLEGETNRIDINSSINIRKEYNNIKLFENSKARWASSYSLNFAQQIAVNQFLHRMEKNQNNLFSVNGPPGTGKTTLLKDIIANVVTKRVEECIRLDDKIFDGKVLHDSLVGKFEIVVASNNNAAVENITLELPKMDDFDFNYIGIKKDDFLLKEFADKFYKFSSWNLISINLGNSTNITSFKSKLNEFKSAIIESEITNDTQLLNKRKDTLINNFNNIKEKIAEKEIFFKKLEEHTAVKIDIETLKNKILQMKNHYKDLIPLNNKIKIEIEESKEKEEETKINIDDAKELIKLKDKELSNFNFLTKILNNSEYKENLSKKRDLEKKLQEYITIKLDLSDSKNELQNKFKENQEKIENIKHNLPNDEKKLKTLEKIKEYQSKLNLNTDDFYNQNENQIQLSTLYNDEEYQKYKAKLFGLAMQLSEIFFLLNSEKILSAIDSFLSDHKKLYNKDQKEKKKLQRDFSSLFLLMPVISTSLAASYNMFKNIDTIGVLLCDEAGQATPQSIVGLLNRAQNALVVGDPLQVEPVFTAASILINLIRDTYNKSENEEVIKDIFSPILSSVQKVADNANSLGSYYKVDGEKLWVGMPLLVHRRCIEPMFSISNRVSYNEKMVLGTPNLKSDDPIKHLPLSKWIDIVSDESDFDSNTSIKELEEVKNFIKTYKDILNDNYYIISPFKKINSFRKKFNDVNQTNSFVGTVHTFQGKEADVVFFILGGNVKTNSKNWVSTKSNLLNVANTRAKKRIYFIGDKNLWSKHKYFKDAIEILDNFNKQIN